MSRLSCHMIVWSQSTHLSQIQTGLVLLQRQGAIRLSQEIIQPRTRRVDRPTHLRNAHLAHMMLIVNGSLKVYIDVHDSWELDELGLEQCDVYFKRSLARDRIPKAVRRNVYPLCFNYEVYPKGFDRFQLARSALGAAQRKESWLSVLMRYPGAAINAQLGRGRRRFHVERMCAPPDLTLEPRVLFMARAWNPADIAEHTPEKIEERRRLNSMRAECIVRLRKEFGERFHGGLQCTEYARKHYPHAVLNDPRLAEKQTYLNLLRQFPICVATAGLHGSTGWKTGEYIAFSKAIVSEPLQYETPGDFQANRNYLVFNTADECVEQVSRLMSDAKLRRSIMVSNWAYYLSFLKPDVLAWRMLERAISHEALTAPAQRAAAAA